MLAALVAKGELPPVDERLPLEPRVAPPVEEIGTYGGTLHVIAINKNPWNDVSESPETAGARFLEITDGGGVVPDLARGYELTDDGMSFTVYMREGAKWSDGNPLTADDVIFAIRGHALERSGRELGPVSRRQQGGQAGRSYRPFRDG